MTLWARVYSLFVPSSPPAILRRVTAVIVAAVERLVFRSRAHVSVEVFKTFQPTLAHRNAATSIVGIVLSVSVVASLFHTRPDVVFGRVSATMFPASISEIFTLPTTARRRVSVVQFIHLDNAGRAAIAPANPSPSPVFAGAPFTLARGFLDNQQAAEPLASQVNPNGARIAAFVHNYNDITMHPGGWLERVAP